jgi:glycosyltransferase involved in cell wall biosynthesis
MRILDVSPRLVWPPENGSSARMFHLLRELSQDHEVRQFSQPRYGEVREPQFATDVWPTPSYREHRNPGLIAAAASEWCHRSWITPQAILSGPCLQLTRPRRLREWLHWAEVVLVEFPWQFAYCRRAAPARPVVLASHNIEILTRTSNALAAGIPADRSVLLGLVRRQERHAVARADLILAVSEGDRREYVRRYGADASRVVVVPNGADTEGLFPLAPRGKAELRAKLGLPNAGTVVYLASGPKVPDVEGLKWVRRVAREQPDLTFLIVGGISPRPGIEGNLIATGLVADHRPYVQAADISLCPIQHGGGTKIKVFDGLAAGLPSVVFAEATEGTALRDGEHVLVAEKSQDALGRAVRRLIDDPRFANELGVAGRRFVCAHHDWRMIARELESVLVEFLGGRRLTTMEGRPPSAP